MTRIAINGIHLNVLWRVGPAGAPVLVLLHGFTGNALTWQPQMDVLSERFCCLAIDALGHGASDAPDDPERYRLERVPDDILALLDRLSIDRFALLGYSMGGRMALHVALMAGPRLTTLILESASPGIGDPGERGRRRESDADLADLLERAGVAAFVDHWERLPLWRSQQRLSVAARQALRAQRLQNDPRGLANSLRGAGSGTASSLTDRLGELTAPVLLIAGADDPRYCEIAADMARLIHHPTVAVVPDAGHAVHLEAPERFNNLVGDFVRTAQPTEIRS
ncbi:MAG: 2-succinyl-6-hydroxy-2,4-cyclohexadiene-1-carboxylate synthase [Herpetosiphon sp.]